MSYLEKLKAKTSLFEELPKVPKGVEMENKATPPTAKSAKRPFDSFDSTLGSRFSEKKDFVFKIEPMTTCLHGQACEYLCAPGGSRPFCLVNSTPVFDLKECPLGYWFPAKGRHSQKCREEDRPKSRSDQGKQSR